jgi:ComF family protein
VQNAIARALSFLGREATRIVLPAWCVSCGADLAWRERVASCCAGCWTSLPKINGSKCSSCALPLAGEQEAKCIKCQLDPLPVAWCEASCHYRGTAERVLHAFKFERHDFFDAPLAALLDEALRGRNDLAFDAVIPVPMTRAGKRRRGYNQAELLARQLAAMTGIVCETKLLRKRAGRATQSTLARAERRANVQDAFVASPSVAGLSLLLVDDIITTGETLRACATALVRERAERVCAIAVAKAE